MRFSTAYIMAATAEETNVIPTVEEFSRVSGMADGLTIRNQIPNLGSIQSSFTNYKVQDGIRLVPLNKFTLSGKSYSVEETKQIQYLAQAIQHSEEINPLIVVKDAQGYYILEGVHRAEALYLLKKQYLPALIVEDLDK
jgi:hypothetical protein